ncbi:Copper-exporting P-type ATPase A [Corynebacterium kalinowskii]|uniref:Copper-exporting P-type ATPase A n=1 Tax=Corynebacterium kalinowskii TaxID=2675216 RepID=A0A6B8VTK9_9CORY|nr:HAD-IC family P-type ATPase [Corynebacterium kalinowskii]QGU02947.1 Copper-exporting P-type ATPase A [Corynebacterium kalinowskii]
MTSPQDTPAHLRSSEKQMDVAIAEAKKAAVEAGVPASVGSDESAHVRLARRQASAHTSFALELEGLESALHVADIEERLDQHRGIRATIVYESATAWITAPDDVAPDEIIAIFADFGVKASLTNASLRRRAERLTQVSRRHVPMRSRKASLAVRAGRLQRKRRRVAEQQSDLAARRAGRLRDVHVVRHHDQEPTEVLFTAKELLTRSRLILSALLSLPIFILSYVPELQFDYWQWLCLAAATPVVSYGAWPFHRATAAGLRRGMSALDAASSAAVISAYLWSVFLLVFTTAGNPDWRFQPQWMAQNFNRVAQGEFFLDVACGVTVFMLLGSLLTRRSRPDLMDEYNANLRGELKQVTVVRKDAATSKSVHVEIPLQEIRVGDDIIVPGGATIPVDGRVIGGAAEVQPGMFSDYTGITEKVKVNSTVHAGGFLLSGPLKIRVHKTGSQTRIAAIHRWVKEASYQQNRSAQLATKTASLLVPWALGIAALDFFMWWLIGGNINAAVASALAILAGVAPVALALSTNLAIKLGIEQSARHGILVRNAETIRELDEITAVIFNRVGTLTEREMFVETISVADGENPELVLRVAGALAMESEHPASKALVRAAREARDAGTGGEDIPHWIEVSHPQVLDNGGLTGGIEIPMKNSDGVVELRQVEATLVRPLDLSGLSARLSNKAVSGGIPIVVSWKGQARGVITLRQDNKPDAFDAVASLEDMGIETVMITRDMYPVARRFADNLGMSRVLAGIALKKKVLAVRSLHTQGDQVAMVGDLGVRECLNVADVGILMQDQVSLDVPEADVVLLRSDVGVVPEAMGLARRISALVDRNILLAWGYNAVVMLLAVAGLLHPMAATLLTIAVTLVIEARSNNVRRF